MHENLYERSTSTINISLNMLVQIAIVLAVVALVVWAMLFANYPPAHDFFHALRHSLYVIPCH